MIPIFDCHIKKTYYNFTLKAIAFSPFISSSFFELQPYNTFLDTYKTNSKVLSRHLNYLFLVVIGFSNLKISSITLIFRSIPGNYIIYIEYHFIKFVTSPSSSFYLRTFFVKFGSNGSNLPLYNYDFFSAFMHSV